MKTASVPGATSTEHHFQLGALHCAASGESRRVDDNAASLARPICRPHRKAAYLVEPRTSVARLRGAVSVAGAWASVHRKAVFSEMPSQQRSDWTRPLVAVPEVWHMSMFSPPLEPGQGGDAAGADGHRARAAPRATLAHIKQSNCERLETLAEGARCDVTFAEVIDAERPT